MTTFTSKSSAQAPQAAPAPAPTYSDRQFLHTQTAGVVLPLLQAFITSGLLAFAIPVLAVVFRWRDEWKVALAIFGVMPFVTWLFLQRRWSVLTAERVLQRDFNGDGVIESAGSGSGEPRLVKVQINHIKAGGSLQADLMTLPCTASQLTQLAESLLNGVPFTEGALSGNGKLFSVVELKLLRNMMLARGLLRMRSEKDARQGYELTDDGKAVMEGALSE